MAVFVRCDRCGKEVKELKSIFNIQLDARELQDATTNEHTLYFPNDQTWYAGGSTDVKETHRFLICLECYKAYYKELME